jgi:hypothetical protein
MSIGAHRVHEKYHYDPLADTVMCVEQKVNFYGVVAEYEQPKPTKGRGPLSPSMLQEYYAT